MLNKPCMALNPLLRPDHCISYEHSIHSPHTDGFRLWYSIPEISASPLRVSAHAPVLLAVTASAGPPLIEEASVYGTFGSAGED